MLENPTAKPARKPPLPALTGIRTLLAFNIVLFHFTPPHLGPLYAMVDNGYVFVNVFFLISGYILTYNYAERADTLVKREFWLARFSRLYPVYLLALLVSFKMLQLEWNARSHTEFFQGLLLTPLLLQGWSPTLATFWNTVAWTLSSEVMLYAAFPWLIRVRWPKKPVQLVLIIIGLWLVNLIAPSLYLWLNPDHLTAPVNRYTSTHLIRFLKYTPLPYVCTFLAGITLGRLQLSVSITSRRRFAIAATALAGLALFFQFVVPRVPYLIMHGGLVMPLFAALVFGLSGPHPISSVFSWRPLLLIGESSYCLYLLHFNGINLIRTYHVPERLHVAAFDPWFSYAVLILFSLAAYHFVEKPARKAILRGFSRRSAVVAPVDSKRPALSWRG